MNQCEKNKFRLTSAGRAVCICIFCPSCCAREKSTSLNTACFFLVQANSEFNFSSFKAVAKAMPLRSKQPSLSN